MTVGLVVLCFVAALVEYEAYEGTCVLLCCRHVALANFVCEVAAAVGDWDWGTLLWLIYVLCCAVAMLHSTSSEYLQLEVPELKRGSQLNCSFDDHQVNDYRQQLTTPSSISRCPNALILLFCCF